MNDRSLTQAAWAVISGIERQTGLTVGFARLEKSRDRLKALAIARSRTGFGIHVSDGIVAPLHNNAPGKALLAFLPAGDREQILRSYVFEGFRTAKTISTVEAFRAELALVRKRGYSSDVSEYVDGCNCVGVPVFGPEGALAAAIWVTGFENHFPAAQFETAAVLLKRAAGRVQEKLIKHSSLNLADYQKQLANRAIRMMKTGYSAPGCSAQAIAEALHVSYSTFRRAFKSATGASPHHYLLLLRLREAAALLETGRLQVRKVAEMTGFEDPNYFSRCFRKHLGRRPGELRGVSPGRV